MNDPHRTACTELALADRFRLARRSVITFDGRRIRSVFAMPVPGGSIVRIHRRRATDTRPQGLHLSSRVDLVVNGHRARDLVLWSTTAPATVEVFVDTSANAIVDIWNTWMDEGIEQAWLGNAGMLVAVDLSQVNPAVQLSCSDGVGAASFDDMVLAVEIVEPVCAATAPRTVTEPAGEAVNSTISAQ